MVEELKRMEKEDEREREKLDPTKGTRNPRSWRNYSSNMEIQGGQEEPPGCPEIDQDKWETPRHRKGLKFLRTHTIQLRELGSLKDFCRPVKHLSWNKNPKK